MGIGPSAPNRPRNNAFKPAGTTAVDDDDGNDRCCWRFLLPASPSRSDLNPRPPSPSSKAIHHRSKCPAVAPLSSRIRSLPKPKKLLSGCSSAEDHYKFIIDACSRIEHLHGEDGLRELGLEYRMVHHPIKCTCYVEFDGDNDFFSHDMLKDQSPTSSFSEESEYSQQQLNCEEEYLVPIGTSLKASWRPQPQYIDTQDIQNDRPDTLTASLSSVSLSQYIDTQDIQNDRPNTLTASLSSVSLFSLATHRTWSSTDRDEMEKPDGSCATRLFRVFPSSSILIEADNYESFIAPGKMYDEVSRLCMEYAQTIMLQEGRLCWASICKEQQIRALVSRTRSTDQAPDSKGRRNVLLIVTGKGKIKAGIFSRRHLITLGIEASTALPMVTEAIQRDMDIVILDPNANGDVNGMDTVDTSLRHLFPAAATNHDERIFVVAHSAAGAQLVRYLLGSKQVGTSADPSSTEEGRAFGHLIRAIAFTDSNHNINWVKKDRELTKMLTGPSSLYIKAHKVHQDEPKGLGEPCNDCSFWRHRFGDIRTIWAGTCEHSLTNYIPRCHIWDHFDSFMTS